MAALAALSYTRRVTLPDDLGDAAPADLLGQARHMLDTAKALLAAVEGQLAAPLPVPADEAAAAEQLGQVVRDARAAVETHELAKETGQAAQGAMYAAVRRLKRTGASRGEISEATGLTESLVKWIVEHHAERRARRRRRDEAGR